MSTRDRVDPCSILAFGGPHGEAHLVAEHPERSRARWDCRPVVVIRSSSVAPPFRGAEEDIPQQPGNKSKKILWVNQKFHRQVRDAKRKTFQEGPSKGAANSRPTPATQPGESGLVDRDFQSDRVEDFHYARVSGGVSTHSPASVLPGYRPFATRLRCGRWHPSQSHAGPAGARREPSAGRRSRTGTRRQGNRAGRHRRACG